MDEHISNLSQDVADLKAWRKVTEPVLREIREDTKQILANQATFNARLGMNVCPAPGKCIELAKEIVSMREDIRDLQDTKREGIGIWKALGIVCGAFVAVAGLVIGVIEVIHAFKK